MSKVLWLQRGEKQTSKSSRPKEKGNVNLAYILHNMTYCITRTEVDCYFCALTLKQILIVCGTSH